MPHSYKVLALITLSFMGITILFAVLSPILYAKISKEAGLSMLKSLRFFLSTTLILILFCTAYMVHIRNKKTKK